jgi:hypothetical protein
MVLTFDSYKETLEREKEKDNDIDELKRSVAFLTNRFNAFLIGQSENKIVYHKDEDGKNNNRTVKGIELKAEIKNKIVGKVKSS